MTLKEIILAEILQSAARKNGFDNWESFERQGDYTDYINADRKALRESLDRLDSVMRWAALNDYVLVGWGISYDGKTGVAWINKATGTGHFTDSQLYELYKEKNP